MQSSRSCVIEYLAHICFRTTSAESIDNLEFNPHRKDFRSSISVLNVYLYISTAYLCVLSILGKLNFIG